MEGTDRTVVDVSKQEIMHWPVPIASKLVPRDRVPPVGIKSTVSESGDFGQGIQLYKELEGYNEKYNRWKTHHTLPNNIKGQ